MLACIGYIVPEYFRWPGYLSPEKAHDARDGPNGARWWIAGASMEQPIHHHQTYMSTYELPCKSSYQKKINKHI